jgi:hypothetical protein
MGRLLVSGRISMNRVCGKLGEILGLLRDFKVELGTRTYLVLACIVGYGDMLHTIVDETDEIV